MTRAHDAHPARFGTVLGLAPGDVPVHSSDYDTASADDFPDRHAFRSYVDGEFMGYKWQCVELARRWMYLNFGYVFDDVPMAFDIFDLRSVRRVADGERLPLQAFRNGAPRAPEVGSLLIWAEGGDFERTGHVAVVTRVDDSAVGIAEQNNEDRLWRSEDGCSRTLRARIGADGGYWIACDGEPELLGWMTQTADETWAEPHERPDPLALRLEPRALPARSTAARSWINEANDDEAAYVACNGQHLSARPEDAYRYVVMSASGRDRLADATNELHAMFMHATDHVLQDDALLARFNLPEAIWPRIHQSWDNRRNQMITGRFDFSMSERGLKLYEYNCDSASCHMETGRIQGRWAEYNDCDDGDDAGAALFADLVEAWQDRPVDHVVHVMLDDDAEELYHALYMARAMRRAGLDVRLLHGVADVCWNAAGEIVDAEGTPVRWVWKTWAWETALDQLRQECENDSARAARLSGPDLTQAPGLVDVLLRPEVMVFEPLWTLVPSNKAILPILWQLYPNHPLLLETAYELTPSLAGRGHVCKPIAGRCGHNVVLVDRNAAMVAETGGRFDTQDNIYQELWPLPVLNGDYVQMCSFTVAGAYAAACVRIDPTPVIRSDSNLIALRVVEDDDLLQ